MPTFEENLKIGSKVPLIKTADLNDKSVTEKKLADRSITKDKIATGAVTSEKIAEGAVSVDEIKDLSVEESKINNKAVTNVKIGDAAVDTRTIEDKSVTNAKIADESITQEKIFNSSVTTEKLADESVSAEKLQSGLRSTIVSTHDKAIELDKKKANVTDVDYALECLENKIGDRVVVEGNVTNLPDDEDLTSVSTIDGREVMRLNDRAYEPSNFSGKGYKILRKNIQRLNLPTATILVSNIPSSSGDIAITINGKTTTVALDVATDTATAIIATKIGTALKSSLDDYDVSVSSSTIVLTRNNSKSASPSSIDVGNTTAGITVKDSITKSERKNVLTQDMINDPNTIYEIRYDFDLNEEEITIPENCVIKYNGGSIVNGTLKYKNGTEIVNTGFQKGVYYLEDFADYNENYNPDEMRDFIQRAINYTAKNGAELIFPQNKTFIVRILPKKGVAENQWGIKRDDGDTALTIPSNIVINLSGSTIQAETNKFVSYCIINMTKECNNSKIINGIILGDRDTHKIPFNAIDKTHEGNSCIQIQGNNCTLENCKLGKVRGDALNISSDLYWNHIRPIEIKSFTNEIIDDTGNVLPNDNYKLSPITDISYLLPDYETVAIAAIASNNKFSFEPFYYVHYYDADNTWLGFEKNFYGDPLNKLRDFKAKKLRFMIKPINISSIQQFWLMGYNYNYNSVVSGCEVFECGRNGITITTSTNTLINNCRIHDIGGTNNEVGIDIEGTSLYNGRCEIRKTIIEKCGVLGVGTSLVIAQGNKIIIDNCVMDIVTGRTSEYLVTNSIFKESLQFTESLIDSFVMNDIWYNKRIENCRFYKNWYSVNSIFENCSFYGSQSLVVTSDYRDAAYTQTMYKNCTFINRDNTSFMILYSDYYKDCRFDLNSSLFIVGFIKNNFTSMFENCDIRCNYIERSTASSYSNLPISIKNSRINQNNNITDRSLFHNIAIKELIDNTINLQSVINNPSNMIAMYFAGLENTIIKDNIINCEEIGTLIKVYQNKNDKQSITIKNNVFNCKFKNSFISITSENPNSIFYITNNYINNKNAKRSLVDVSKFTEGKCFIYDNTLINLILNAGKCIYYRYSNYISNTSINEYTNIKGTTEERPVLSNTDDGFEYYDSTLKKKILWNGTAWVNIDGTALS